MLPRQQQNRTFKPLQRRADGFFRTGDLGRLDGEGRFIFETRRGDAIRLAGFLVDPMEIEDALRRNPAVQGAQVVAVEIGGEPRPVAFVIPAPGRSASEAEIIASAGPCARKRSLC